MIGLSVSFADFKKSFYERVTDFSIFDCGDINLLKVVLDGLKVNYAARGKYSTLIFRGKLVYETTYFLKSLKKRPEPAYSKKSKATLFFFDTNRAVEIKDGFASQYFQKLKTLFNKEDFIHFVNSEKNKIKYDFDYSHTDSGNAYSASPLAEEDRTLLKKILATYNVIEKKNIFSAEELQNIKAAFQLFFDNVRVWNRFLSHFNLKTCLLICHYHNESLIYALKKKGVKTIELQHGIIAEEDLFYLFPPAILPVRKKALFCDEIAVYGTFWKNLLARGSEYPATNVFNVGTYFNTQAWVGDNTRTEIEKFKDKSKIILLTTQTFLDEHFIKYAQFLIHHIQTQKLNYKIILRKHPNEAAEVYSELNDNEWFLKTSANLYYLFSISDLHVSIYSTTLIEALQFNVINYCLNVPALAGYTDFMIKNNISTMIGFNEFPSGSAVAGSADSESFYGLFDKKKNDGTFSLKNLTNAI